eukprot:5051909-Amphidinium_carterae.1
MQPSTVSWMDTNTGEGTQGPSQGRLLDNVRSRKNSKALAAKRGQIADELCHTNTCKWGKTRPAH